MQKATLRNVSTGAKAVEVLFNPTEYTLTRGANYAEIVVPGLPVPVLQFIRGEMEQLQLELFLDGSEERKGIEDALGEVRALCTIDGKLHAPPVCEFAWGGTFDTQKTPTNTFQGVVTNLQEKFVLFDDKGKPLRARLTVTLKRYQPVDVQLRDAKLSSPDRTRTHVVREGDRLDLIALDEYGDATFWSLIAEANDLARPRRLVPGTVLVLPAV